MLGQGRFELDRVQLTIEPHQRHDRDFRIDVQKDAEAAGLKVEINQGDALMQRRERQREVGSKGSDADSSDQADYRNDHPARATLSAPASLADFQQGAGSLPGVKRHEQNL